MIEREYERGCSPEMVDESSSIIRANDCCNKLDVHNWFRDISEVSRGNDIIEIRFKNTRKAYYQNVNQLNLREGELVAVEASPGHDIGIVSLIGELVAEQMEKLNISPKTELKKVYRKARQVDIQKWKEAISREMTTMLRTREMAKSLKLQMKIGDVEFQGDNTKAIFYYIADERVDFRELIKLMADEFRIRIEMRQIGARQEAGRIGGIAPCGRELCCSTWMSNFVSVTTNTARLQELSPNPQKLAGQCGKLKCCINFEIDVYQDARKQFPHKSQVLKLKNGVAYHIKNDVFKQLMYYEVREKNEIALIKAVPIARVKEILEMNTNDSLPEKLLIVEEVINDNEKFSDVSSDNSLTRFDNAKKKKKKKKNRNKSRGAIPLIALMIFFASACNKGRVYEKYQEIPNSVWESSNILSYEFDIDDTLQTHDIYLNVRNSSHYPFKNIWVFVYTTVPNGLQVVDTFEITLANEKGEWLGDGLGDIWDKKTLFKKSVIFPVSGTYKMQIEQGMRIEKIPGIMDVGIAINKTEK